jgi:hypothetical protein
MDSAMVGMPGSDGERAAVVTASGRSEAALMGPIDADMGSNIILPADQILQRGPAAGVRHVDHVDTGHELEQLAGHVRRAAGAGHGHPDLARIGLRIGDELRNGLGPHRRVHHHDERLAGDAGDRRDVAQQVETEILEQRGVDRVRRTDEEQRMAVGRRAHHRFGRRIAGGARQVLDDDGLSQPLREPFTQQAREDVVRSAGNEADDQPQRARRIGLRQCRARNRGKHGGDPRKLQELTARKFHGDPFSDMLATRRSNARIIAGIASAEWSVTA